MATHRYAGMTLEAPEDWNDLSTVVLVGPLNAQLKTQPRVVVSRQKLVAPMPVGTMARAYADQLPGTIEGCRVLESEAFPLRGLEGHRVVFEMQPEGSPAVTRMQVFAARGDDLFVLTTDALSESFTQLRPTLERVMASFRLES